MVEAASSQDDTVATLLFRDLHAALTRCMETHPPVGLERSLHPDANTLAGLWGLMSYQRLTEVP